jgi:hypothetical protein
MENKLKFFLYADRKNVILAGNEELDVASLLIVYVSMYRSKPT